MHTIIVGGGFAGVRAALQLSRRHLGKITLISDEPYFLHHPTLYATATGRSTKESVVSLDEIFADHYDIKVVHDRMTSLDANRHLVVGNDSTYHYDNLILALGVVTCYFGIKGMDKHSYGIKTLEEVSAFNDHLHDELGARRHLDKNYVIIGGGATGVELAGSLVDYLHEIAESHRVSHKKVNVTLVEAAPRLLPRLSKTASRVVSRRLERLGVKIMTNHKVDALRKDHLTIDGKKHSTETAIWTSGVTNNPFYKEHPDYFTLAKNGRVDVDQYLEAYKDVYVIGDNANVSNTGQAWPALQSADFIAQHLARKTAGRMFREYSPRTPLSAVPVGDGWAYVEYGGVYLAGRSGYAVRRHIELAGYKALLPSSQAKGAWRAHLQKEESCTVCKISS